MVIQPNNINTNANTAGKAKQTIVPPSDSHTGTPSKPSSGNAKDSVSLSPEAKSIANIEANIHHASDIDAQKIADIKAAITSGGYKIDSNSIAKAMLDDESYV